MSTTRGIADNCAVVLQNLPVEFQDVLTGTILRTTYESLQHLNPGKRSKKVISTEKIEDQKQQIVKWLRAYALRSASQIGQEVRSPTYNERTWSPEEFMNAITVFLTLKKGGKSSDLKLDDFWRRNAETFPDCTPEQLKALYCRLYSLFMDGAIEKMSKPQRMALLQHPNMTESFEEVIKSKGKKRLRDEDSDQQHNTSSSPHKNKKHSSSIVAPAHDDSDDAGADDDDAGADDDDDDSTTSSEHLAVQPIHDDDDADDNDVIDDDGTDASTDDVDDDDS
eukprot:c9932_g1_i3.p1 GENE.c9932_g1_i3~~c9932_g1_i3.p1  ORF type:complete len:294 (+),score=86.24 c9932_g1_i3:45-884(+)